MLSLHCAIKLVGGFELTKRYDRRLRGAFDLDLRSCRVEHVELSSYILERLAKLHARYVVFITKTKLRIRNSITVDKAIVVRNETYRRQPFARLFDQNLIDNPIARAHGQNW